MGRMGAKPLVDPLRDIRGQELTHLEVPVGSFHWGLSRGETQGPDTKRIYVCTKRIIDVSRADLVRNINSL